jgi:hypothetical protein
MSVSLFFFTMAECHCLLALYSLSFFPTGEPHLGMSGEESVMFCLTTLVFADILLCGE